MIYTQRPEATACAEWDFWNQRMRRYIRRGSRGIALIDNSQGKPTLRYVFDVADTDQKDEKGRNPNLWQYREEHHDAVTAALEERFEVSGADGLTDQLGQIAAQLAGEYWTDHQYDLLHIVDGSFLEEYDELNIEMAFRSAATVSIAYTLMSRCGLEPENYFQHEDFLRTCIHNLKRRVDGSFPAIPRCVFLKCTKHSRENAPCLAGKFFAHPASSAVNTGSKRDMVK